jgi:chemotaxis signal transduction protein
VSVSNGQGYDSAAATPQLATRAALLRDEFDRSFAEPIGTFVPATQDFLALSVDGLGFALRLTEIAGLHVDRKVTRMPSSDPALLGIAGFRGLVLPVYGIGAVLGRPGTSVPRWLIVARPGAVALAFDGFDGYHRVGADAVGAAPSGGAEQPFIRDFVAIGSIARPILYLPSILEHLAAKRPALPASQEQ